MPKSTAVPERWVPFLTAKAGGNPPAMQDLIKGEEARITGDVFAAYLEAAYQSGIKKGSRDTAAAMALIIQKIAK